MAVHTAESIRKLGDAGHPQYPAAAGVPPPRDFSPKPALSNLLARRLLERFFRKVVKRGRLEVIDRSGTVSSFGESAPGFPAVRIRFLDDDVVRDILVDPRLGAGEAFMAGRLLIEEGDVMQLIQLLRANRPWESGAKLHKAGWARSLIGRGMAAADGINLRLRSRRNVAHH